MGIGPGKVTDPRPTRREPRARLEALATGPDDAIDLAEAALWIAAVSEPDLDVAFYRGRINSLATTARKALGDATNPREKVERLNRFLFEERGYAGNRDDYYDPRNSQLNDVVDRRVGIPITLAILWIAVAKRIGIEACGVGFPGHFLAMARGEPSIVVDAFEGRILSEEDCAELFRRAAGRDASFDPQLLSPTPPREILARVLRNLVQIYVQRGELVAALSCADPILAFTPDAPGDIRDRGLLHRALECWAPARDDLIRYLELAPHAPDASKIRAILGDAEHAAARLN